MTLENDLRHQSEVADAKLGVAEELGWAVAVFAGVSVYLKWDSWLFALAFAIGAYFFATYRYRRWAAQAEDGYFRAAGLGKYASGQGTEDA